MWYWAVAIAVLALSIRLSVLSLSWTGEGAWNLETDSARYIGLADSLIAGKGFTLRLGGDQYQTEYLTLPPYPLFLAVTKSMTDQWIGAALVIQCLLSTGVSVGLFFLALWLLGLKPAILAGLLASIDLQSIVYTNLILTDMLGMTATFLAAAALVVFSQKPRTSTAALCGLAFGLSASIRPVMMYLWVVPAIVAMLQFRRIGLRQVVVCVVTIALLTLLPVVAWSARNLASAGSWFYSTTPDIALVNWQLARLLMETEGVSQKEARQLIASRLGIADTWLLAGPVDPRVRSRARAVATALIRDHPVVFTRLYFEGLLRVLIQPDPNLLLLSGQLTEPTNLAQGKTTRTSALILRWRQLSPGVRALYFGQLPWMLALWVFATFGVLVGILNASSRMVTLSLLGLIAIILAAAGGYPGDPRYRLPVMPAVELLAAAGVSCLAARRTSLTEKSPLPRASATR